VAGQADVSPEAARRAEAAADEAEAKLDEAACPPIDFNTFVLSLSTSAIVHLGAAPKELFDGQEPPPKNLPMAKQTIDCIAMLEDKTQGNLSGEEERLLSQILYDLRMRYVRATKDA
tara:strand:+ start:2318 stop:2668 length:351 start_codon:yes stop_codon:yes gene_type:complete